MRKGTRQNEKNSVHETIPVSSGLDRSERSSTNPGVLQSFARVLCKGGTALSGQCQFQVLILVEENLRGHLHSSQVGTLFRQVRKVNGTQ